MKHSKVLDADEHRREFFEFIESQKSKRSKLKDINKIIHNQSSSQKTDGSSLILTETDLRHISSLVMGKLEDRLYIYIEEIRKILLKDMECMFEDSSFLKRFEERMEREIVVNINNKISNFDYRELAKNTLITYAKTDLQGLIKDIVHKTVISVMHKYERERQITKELIYSINSEIKHVLADCPISYESETQIIKEFKQVIHKTSDNILKIESKKQKTLR